VIKHLPFLLFFLSMSILSSCHSQTDVSTNSVDAVVEVAGEEVPSDKEIIYMVMQLHEVPLVVHPSCEGMGMDFDDTTIGQFMSGFWAYQSESAGVLDINVETAETTDGIERWTAKVMIEGIVEETPYSAGISFDIRKSDKEVEVESVRCLGAG